VLKVSLFWNKLVFLAISGIFVLTSCAGSSTALKIDTQAAPVTVNDTITIPVKVENISDLIAMEIHLSFDPARLEVVQLKNGGFVKADYVVQNTFDNTNGTLDYAVAQIAGSPASGSGTLLEIVFRAKEKGQALINFHKTQAAPDGAIFSNSRGTAINVSFFNGTLEVK